MCSRSTSRLGPRSRFPSTSARRSSSRSEWGPSCGARPERTSTARWTTSWRSPASCSRPTLVAPETLAEATTVAFPGLNGVLPGFGRFDPLDWGLGFELKDGKPGHWTGSLTSPRTFGHFGGSGTFLWVDPERELALACLTDREFDDWALTAWPALSDAVLEEVE